VTALLTTVDSWLRKLEEGRDVAAVFFDLRKAFDSVPHKTLIEQTGVLGLQIISPTGSKSECEMESVPLLKQRFQGYHRAESSGHCWFRLMWMTWRAYP